MVRARRSYLVCLVDRKAPLARFFPNVRAIVWGQRLLPGDYAGPRLRSVHCGEADRDARVLLACPWLQEDHHLQPTRVSVLWATARRAVCAIT